MMFLLAGMLLVLPAPTAAAAHPPATVQTHERNCYETDELASVPVAELRTLVPARYTISTAATEPTVGTLVLIDYACDTVQVGRDGAARPATVTLGVVMLSARDGVPGLAWYLLWHGSDNPRLVRALRHVGIPSRVVRATSRVTPLADGRSRVEAAVRGARLDHRLVAEVVEPPGEPVTREDSAPIYVQGRRGEVEWDFANFVRPPSSMSSTVAVGPRSLLAELGIPPTSTYTTPFAGFLRGGYVSTATRKSSS